MLKIAICDSNKVHLQEIYRSLECILFDEFDYIIDTYSNSADFVENGDFSYNIIFLEIDLYPHTGLNVAKFLRKKHVTGEIVFLTKDSSYVFEGYKYNAFDYLIKPISLSQLTEVIQRYADIKLNNHNSLMIKHRNEFHRISFEKIFYILSAGRKLVLITESGNIEYYGKLIELEQCLPKNKFIRVHQSYLVNIEHIDIIQREELHIDNGDVVPISRARQESIRQYCERLSVNA
ncbi:MAG: response regulator transcription factor [Clostridia bacterium]|nr:response regulator transcription factor [Clostridia bacterium]